MGAFTESIIEDAALENDCPCANAKRLRNG